MGRLRRKNNHFDEVDNHERWLISYADFVTLLFAFFVVMYSISSVNNAKFENLSEALDHAFSKANKNSMVINADTVSTIEAQPKEKAVIKPTIINKESSRQNTALSEEILKERHLLQGVAQQLEGVLQPYIENNLITVVRNDFWIELEMNSQLLFSSGEAKLAETATPVLKKVARMLNSMPNVINIEGHTDNVPIDNIKFSSNWELSSARATSVVRKLIDSGIAPERLSAVGYGEHHPVAKNTTENERAQNRRVVLVLMSQAFARYGMSDKKRAEILGLGVSSETELN